MPAVDVDGTRVHFEAPLGIERRGRARLVMLHGFGGSSRHFAPITAHLTGVAPLVFDMPGHGQSSGEALGDVPAMARFVAHVLDRLVPGETIALLGHSFGGLVAAQVALDLGPRVDALVIVASAPRVRLHPEMVRQALSGEWEESFLRGSFGRGAIEEHIRIVLEDLRALRLRADESLLARWTSYDIQPRLGAIDARALVIAATDDVILSPRHGATWARALRRARLVEIAGAGHYVQLEEARAVAEYVRAFVVTETAKGVERP